MDRTLSPSFLLRLVLPVMAALWGCATDNVTNPATAHERETRAAAAIEQFKREDPGIGHFFDTAAGYAVFPKCGKGGLIFGGGYGEGVVYTKGGTIIGYATMTLGTVGAQVGGQGFKEIIFFKDSGDLDALKHERVEFDAHATAVAIRTGASSTATYNKGMVVFVTGEKGFMAEAVVGGQTFRYFPK